MNATFQRVKEIFLACLEKDGAGDRAAFLSEACGTDEELRRQVDALLCQHAQAGSFLEKPPAREAGDTGDFAPGRWVDQEALATTAPLEGPGTRIGPYKLLQQLGEGGMGTVFLAEQTQPVQRKVALKIIKAGMDSAHVIARFEAERQALALMDHPNIAKVLDAGTTDAGRPFFVMELVKGIPLTKFCDQERLTPQQRLELFIPVCQAVQHAHQKGIIHRDLKPSNVLIALYDGRPVPKVIDFGVAKAAGPKLTERTLFTEVGQIVGTLEYMSPEQAELNNQDIDTRSDIYSLGVLLYELLTGTTPLDRARLKKAAFTEMLRLIREEEPPKPSTRLSDSKDNLASISAQRQMEPAKLTKLLRGELDWIIMKALEKDRARRYETANGLARDLERYLADEPVEACPPSAGYRLRKFARKHKKVLTTAAAFVVLLAAAAVISTAQAVWAMRAEADAVRARGEEAARRQEAEQQRQRAELAEQVAKKERDDLQRTVYIQRITEAQRQGEAHWVGRADELLDDCLPRLRGWEWHHLRRLRFGNTRTLRGHTEIIRSVAFSADNRHLASGGDDKIPRLWDATTGEEVRKYTSRQHNTYGVAFSPDGLHLASGHWDKTVKLWNVATGRRIHDLKEHTQPVTSVAVSPDGKCLAASADKTVKIWDVATGELVRTLESATSLRAIAYSPDGVRLAAAAGTTVKLWDAVTGHEGPPLPGHRRSVFCVAFSPDGRRLVSGSEDGTVKLWNMHSGAEERTFPEPGGPVYGVAFSPDGRRIASTGVTSAVQLWDPDTGEEILRLRGPEQAAGVCVAFSPDGQRLAAGWMDKTITVWDATPVPEEKTPREIRTLNGHTDWIWGVAYSPDGRQLSTTSQDGTVQLWDPETGRSLRTFPFPLAGPGSSVAYSPDGRLLAAASGSLILWDLQTGQEGRESPRRNYIWGLALAPDGKSLATADSGGTVTIRDLAIRDGRTGNVSDTLYGQRLWARGVAYSPDGKWLASVGDDKTVLIWDLATRQTVVLPILGPSTVGLLGATLGQGPFLPAAALLPGSNGPRHRLEGHTGAVQRVAFSPDGHHLASTGYDGIVMLWDTATWKERWTRYNHFQGSFAVAFSPDGRYLAAGCGSGRQGRVVLWETATGREMLMLGGHSKPVASVAFSPNGRYLASASLDGTVKLWDVSGLSQRATER